MRTYPKRLLTVVMVLAMLVSMMAVPGMAAETDNTLTVGNEGGLTLPEALNQAASMTGDVTVEIYGQVTLNTTLSGSYDSIKFVGKDADAEIYLDITGYITATGKKVAFEGLTLSKSEGGFIDNAGFMNVAFGIYDVTEVTYTNCNFANGAYASSGKVTYTGCSFKRSHDKYGLWAYGDVDATVDNCTFADYRGIKMYAEGKLKTTNLTVKNSNFSAVTDKPAIVLTCGESVTLTNNTYSNTGVFELDLDGVPNGTPVTSDVAPSCVNDNGACGVLVDGKIYTTVAQAAAVATSGSTVILLHDSTETVELPEGVSLVKNGYTASGVTATNPVAIVNGDSYASLSAAIANANGQTVELLKDTAGSGVVINKNVTIDFGGNTYTFTEPAVGSSGTESNGFQILSGNTVTLKNGSLAVSSEHASKYYILVQNYANLTVTDMNLDGTYLDKWSGSDGDSYVLSNNCGTVTVNGNTSITANDDGSLAYTVDSHLKSGYTAPTVTIDTTGTINGKLEVSGGNMIVNNGTFHARKVGGAYTDTDVFVVSSGLLTINYANVDGGDMEDTTAVWAHTSGKAVINGGTFTLSGKNVSTGHNDMIYAGKTNGGSGAVIEVKGGTFSATDVTNPGTNGANVWLLNEKDGQGSMTVTGGTFEDFNPAAVYTEPTQPTSFLADGHCVSVADGNYTVGQHNIKPVAAKPATCTENGMKAHYACDHCGLYEDAEGNIATTAEKLVIPADSTNHNLYKAGGTNATCKNGGYDVHYICKDCGSCFADAEGKVPAKEEDFYKPKLDHKLTFVKSTVTCTESGSPDHYECSLCDGWWTDKECTTIIGLPNRVVDATGHKLTKVEAKAPTCTEDGVNAHYTCSGCDLLFNDPKGLSTITKQQATAKATGHKAVMGVEGKLPTCTEPGNIEYVECSCGALFTDAECKNPITAAETVIPTVAHKLTKIPAVAVSCNANGNTEYYTCETCKALFADAEGKTGTTAEKVVITATGHALTKVAAVAATCTTAGNTEYYTCANCKALFADAEGKTATTAEKVTVAATGHKLTKVEAVAPTYTADGSAEHYACACGALFADAEGKTATTKEALILPQLIEIKESTAEVSTGAVDTAIKEAETTGSVTIDLVEVADEEAAKPEDGTETKPEPAPVVSSAALPVTSLEKVAEISEEATLTLNMTEVTVTMDAKTMAAVAEQSAGATVTLKVEKIETKALTEEQQAVIEDKEVAVVVTATMISNNVAISDFKGGEVTIALPFTLPEGTEGSDFQVYYVADDGTMTAHETEYKNGCLVFSTTHFSDYVVVNTAAPADPTVPNTGDNANLLLSATAFTVALTGLAVLFIGKKKFSF